MFFFVLINAHRHLKIKIILLYLAILPILWCKMADRQTRQIQLLCNTSQTEQEYSTDGEIRIHICARYAYFQSCCWWWTRRRRYYSNGCRSRIVAICDCVRGPERFTTYQTFIRIDCRYKLEHDWVRIWMHFLWDIGHHWHHCITSKGLVWARGKKNVRYRQRFHPKHRQGTIPLLDLWTWCHPLLHWHVHSWVRYLTRQRYFFLPHFSKKHGYD